MITTICMNPSFDKTVEVDAFRPGHVNRILRSRTDAGGKGLNVAVVARRLGMEAQVVGIAGSDGARVLETALEREGAGHAFLLTDGSVRINTKVVSLDGSGVTEINEPGPVISAEMLDRFIRLVCEKAAGSEYVVLTGSLPPGCPDDTYARIINALDGIPCILDAGGNALLRGVEAKPFLIKPNHHELAAAVGRELHTCQDMIQAARCFTETGVGCVVVSMGKDGAMLVTGKDVYYAPEIPVTVRSTVGAGDSLVAGLICGFMQDGSAETALRCGAAAGTASVMTEGTQLIIPEDFHTLLQKVRIQHLQHC